MKNLDRKDLKSLLTLNRFLFERGAGEESHEILPSPIRRGIQGEVSTKTNKNLIPNPSSTRRMEQTAAAFSLMEMMVVMLVVAVVMALSAPMITKKAVGTDGKLDLWTLLNGGNIGFNTKGTVKAAIIGGAQAEIDKIGTDLGGATNYLPRFILNTSGSHPHIGFMKDGATTGAMTLASNGVALGYKATTGSDPDSSVAIGNQANTTKHHAVAIGRSATAALGGVAVGDETVAGDYGVAIGDSNNGTTTVKPTAGSYGVAIGYGTQGTGSGAVAIGQSAQGTTAGAVAIGRAAKATSAGCVAIGNNANTTGSPYSFALGDSADASSGHHIMAIGDWANATRAWRSVAVGCVANAQDSSVTIAMGTNVSANRASNSIALGYYPNVISAKDSIAMGYSANAYASNNSIAMGRSANAYAGNNSIAMGYSTSSGNHSIAMGYSANASSIGSIAIGSPANATYNNSIAIGTGAKMKLLTSGPSYNTIIIGPGAYADSSYATSLGTQANSTLFSTAVGSYANARGAGSIVMGHQANSTSGATFATAIGAYSQASGRQAIAIGAGDEDNNGSVKYRTIASHANSVAIGGTARGWVGSVYGYNLSTNAYGTNSLAVGSGCRTHYDDSIAMGIGSYATRTNSMAIGVGAKANHANSTAIGYHAVTSNTNQIVLGTKDSVVYIPGNLIVGKYTWMGESLSKGFDSLYGGERGSALFLKFNTGNPIYRPLHEKSGSDDDVIATDRNVPTSKAYSDKRLKDIISENLDAMDKINRLKVYDFTFKTDDLKTPRVGVIAQELEKVFPNAISKDENGYLQIRHEDIFYAMINALKELDAKIKKIASEVSNGFESLKVQVTKSNSDLAKLNARIDKQDKEIKALKKEIAELKKLVKAK